jgi:hypothetical protein
VGFEALIEKVHQAETALEARERAAAADWRQLKSSWRATWTPGRIVIAGLVSGFVVGKLEPVKKVASGGGLLNLLSAAAGLFAGGSAQAAAGEAAKAADTAEQTAAVVDPDSAAAVAQAANTPPVDA